MTLESIPGDDKPGPRDELTPPLDVPLRRNGNGSTGSSNVVPSRRQQGIFGRVFPPVNGRTTDPGSDDYVKVEPKSDPAADAALKRRIERQITEVYGARLKSFEVRVVGRQVAIRARAGRFWQRRSLRTGIESLPALSGTKAYVEVID